MTVRLVDCRSRDAYDAGHVPEAVHLDPESELSTPTADPSVGGRHPLPDPHALAAAFARAGIGPAMALKDLGIEVLANVPGVGQRLMDHPSIAVA